MEKLETAGWKCRFRLSKYREDIGSYRGREVEFHRLFVPYEVREGEGNCLLNTGINEIWDLVTGDSASHFDNTEAQIGVGDATTGADPDQTDLQAETNKTYKGMESGYPISTAQNATFKASFGTDDGNYTWNEWVIRNASSEICLNRKVESLGTKSGGTWTIEVEVSLS